MELVIFWSCPDLRHTIILCTALKHSEKVKIIVKKISIVSFDKKNSAVQKNQLNLSKYLKF